MVARDIPRTVKPSHSLHEISSAGTQREEDPHARPGIGDPAWALFQPFPFSQGLGMAHTEPMSSLLYRILYIQDPAVSCPHVLKPAPAFAVAPSSKGWIMSAFKPT